MPGTDRRPPTLCWDCANALGGCSWASPEHVPVRGWIAARYDMRTMYGGMEHLYESYIVIQCPEFDRDAWMAGSRRLEDPPGRIRLRD